MTTYNLNVHFSRPDENNAVVYYVGYCLDAGSHEDAVRMLRERTTHLTLLSEPHLLAVVTEDGNVISSNYRDLDALTKRLSAFDSFAALLDAKGGYRPTIHLDRSFALALADAYDAAQAARGDERRAYRRPAADVGDDATYELSLTNLDGTVGTSQIPGRALAETCLREFAQGAGLDVHIHPTVYTDGSRSTAFRRGGDSLFDAVAMLRRLF